MLELFRILEEGEIETEQMRRGERSKDDLSDDEYKYPPLLRRRAMGPLAHVFAVWPPFPFRRTPESQIDMCSNITHSSRTEY